MDINKIYRKVLLKRAKKIFRGGLLERIFIKAAINKADNQKDSLTLFIGSSYAQYGIISNKYKNAILIASPSQDMYYATRIIHELLQKKIRINKCIMIMGYYAPYHDLSLQQKERINFCGGVYYPLLNDAHHWDTPINNNHWHKEWRYPKKIIEWVNKSIYEYLYETNSYYDDLNSRTILKRNVDIEWAKKTHEEKIILAEKRTGCHNKLLKFLDTYNDNIMIMKEFKQLLIV